MNHEIDLSFNRVGTYLKAINSLAYVLRFINNCKLPRSERLRGPLSAAEVEMATRQMWRLQQMTAFGQERECITQGKNLPKGSALVRLNPFLCEQGLLRVGGRLRNAALPYEERFPIIIPKCHVMTLLIRQVHIGQNHAGVDTICSLLNKHYHIFKVKPVSKRIKKICIPCQRIDKRKCNQVAPPLPGYRVNPDRPFANIGLDFAGPLHCKSSPKKYYFIIFVCSVVRAIHLELTSGINLEELKLAFFRFTARRGVPSLVISDNAPTFAAGARSMAAWFPAKPPLWTHIAPRAPWWGGLYERHIKTVKAALKKTVGKARLKPRELETTIIQIEGMMNTRPLVLSEDVILTPSHFLLPHLTDAEENKYDHISSLYINQQNALKEFWNSWSNLYLKSLPKLVPKHKEVFPLKIGDIVLCDNEHISANKIKWPLGKIIEIIESSDQRVRTVKVQTENGTYVRPVQRLIHLEMKSHD